MPNDPNPAPNEAARLASTQGAEGQYLPIQCPHVQASGMNIISAGTEVIVIFNKMKPLLSSDGSPDSIGLASDPVSVISMSVLSAKDLILLLQGAVKNYEKDFGVLNTPFLTERVGSDSQGKGS